MAAVMKYLLGLCIVLCCMQFIEMGRLRREDAPTTTENEITKGIKEAIDKFQEVLNNEKVKELLNDATNTLNKGTEEFGKAFKETVAKLKEQADTLIANKGAPSS